MGRPMRREHGTLTGYWQHHRLGEDRCRACRTAYNNYRRELRRVRRLLGLG